MPEDKQGTGKHPHRSTEEPYPHHEGSKEGERGRGSSGGEQQGRSSNQGGSSSESGDLKEREYRDEKGEVHHHTHTYEEQHNKK